MLRKFLGGGKRLTGRRSRKQQSHARRAFKHETLEARRLLAADTLRAFAADLDSTETEEVSTSDDGLSTTVRSHLNGLRHGRGHHRGNNVSRVIAHLESGIEAGDLPGDLTAEDAQGIIDGLNAAVESGDTDAASELLAQVAAAHKLDHIRDAIAGYQTALDAATEAGEETLYGLPVADVAASLAAANEALEAGDLDAANDAVEVVRDAKRTEARAARQLARVTSKVERLNASLAAAAEAGDETYRGVSLADAQAYAETATNAIEAGDVDGAQSALGDLYTMIKAIRNADRNEAKVDALNAGIAAAVEAGDTTYKGISIEEAQGYADAANAAVDAADPVGVQSALNDFRAAIHLSQKVAKVEARLVSLQAAVDAATEAGETTVGNATVEDVQTAIDTATEALASGDVDAAEEAIRSVASSSHGGGHRGRGRGRGRR